MNETHLSDDRLIEICVSGSMPGRERSHLAACPTCEHRRASIVEILDEVDVTATEEADVAFPADRLERQQARILHRIDRDGRPGRVITFPAHQPAPAMPLRSRPRTRWAAAVAAAAFVVGLLAGHFAHELPIGDEADGPRMVGTDSGAAPLRAVSTTFSEDEFLQQVEAAAGQNGPAALRALDEMTPRAWEVR
jgi:hypothetical protein